jgi:hypothetical protein
MNCGRGGVGLAGAAWPLVVLAAMALGMPESPVWGETAASSASGQPSKDVCVDAEVNGERALSYDCLNGRLNPASAAQGASGGKTAEGIAKSPSNQVGTFNWSAESNRFGNAWQKSATPQRPAPVPAVPPAAH